MGAWGAGLYQDDVSCDIKEEYVNRLRVGMTNEEATQEVIDYNLYGDEDDEPIFWFALADIQWKYGRLLPEVKEEALKHIESGENLARWKEENEKQYPKRKKVLEELKERLNSPQPVEKKVSKLQLNRPIWNVGDVLLHKIEDERLKDSKWYGKYVLFRMVGTDRTNVGSLPRDIYYNEQSVLALYNWVGTVFNLSKEQIEKLQYIGSADIYDKTHQMTILCRRDAKGIKFDIVATDKEYIYPRKHEITGLGIMWDNKNTIDYTIYRALKKAEENGILNET